MAPRCRSRMGALVAVAAFAAVPLVAADPPPPRAAPDAAGFRATVQPFLATHCVRCHNAKKAEGRLDLTKLGADLAAGQSADAWQAVADRVSAGEMPPEGEQQPDPAAVRAVTGWVSGELTKAGKTAATAPGSLRTGNHVPHALLFGPDAGKAPLDSPPRLWRVSPFIYAEGAKAFKGLKLAQPFSLPPGDGFKDQAAGGGIDESTAAQLMRNAEALADEQLGLTPRKSGDKKALKELAPLLEAAPSRAQIDAAVAYAFDVAMKRKPSADELKRFAALYAAAAKLGGPEGGARAVHVAVLLQPEASFRSELGAGAASGKRMLAPREVAFAVAYALTDRAPDAELLRAADGGRLATPADVSREVARLFADAKADKPRVMRFFREYFGYGGAPEVFKEPKQFPAHAAAGLVADTDRLIQDVLDADKNVFAELLTTTKGYVHHRSADKDKSAVTDAVAKFEADKKKDPKKYEGKDPPGDGKRSYLAYNLPDFADRQPVDLPRAQRAGVLTQPAWLVANSENFDNHAIRRGKWVRERLLGGTVPDVPITVDAQLPDAPHKTLRERMEVTREKYCWQCHAKMNPIGLAFEMYDHFGRWRDRDTVTVEGVDAKGKKTQAPKTVPLDTTGRIDGTGDPAVDGDYPDAVTMVRRLAASDRARQVFVRHAFRFWMGRPENAGDARTLVAADQAYLKSGGSMRALITALLASESFLYRTAK